MLKRFKIDGRMQEVFVLRETTARIVFVPIKSMHRVDYERFKEMLKAKPPRADLLDYMTKYRLKNGLNALIQYDNLIQVANIHNNVGTRIKKTDEITADLSRPVADTSTSAPANAPATVVTPEAPEVDDVDTLELSSAPKVPSYRYTDKHGKQKIWSGKGRVPDTIAEYVTGGGDMDDFLEV
ncbi:hypothetical protein [Alishewanella phage vB_AspM_Slicko01]|nr:hypothetical protein [Alishewanella phage vB_AspM_Slicko01]